MKRAPGFFAFAILLSLSGVLVGQSTQTASNDAAPPAPAARNGAVSRALPPARGKSRYASRPFSRIAFGGGISAMGMNMQTAVAANRFMNLRGVGNLFNYSLTNISTNGMNVSGSLNLASAGAAVDIYPFWRHGFRLSPGALFYNRNMASVNVTAPGGTSFSLNNNTYYSSQANPVSGSGGIGLRTNNPAFTFTTGWGNMIPRRGGHFSFPFEIGAAMIGAPAVGLVFTGGQVCSDPQGTQNCMNVVGNSDFESNLQAQLTKYQNDVNPFRYYPIVSLEIAYSFNLRGQPAK